MMTGAGHSSSSVARRVLRVDVSPVNARRWVLSLSCGHDLWVTSEWRPVCKTVKCFKCLELQGFVSQVIEKVKGRET